MRFERGKDPKDALNIGEAARIKNEIIAILPQIIDKYIFEMSSPKLGGHLAHDIESLTGHKVEVNFILSEVDFMITVINPDLKRRIRIKATFPW